MIENGPTVGPRNHSTDGGCKEMARNAMKSWSNTMLYKKYEVPSHFREDAGVDFFCRVEVFKFLELDDEAILMKRLIVGLLWGPVLFLFFADFVGCGFVCILWNLSKSGCYLEDI